MGDLCSKCKQKPRAGKNYWCRDCQTKYKRAYYEARPGLKAAERARERAQRPESYATARKRWKQTNRRAKKVHEYVRLAVKRGRLIRPEACSECGSVGPVHAHHEDYRKPYNVRWLCHSCHMRRHRRPIEKAAA